MDWSTPHKRRGTGLVRTLVVGAATLAILLVCFSIYQYSQLDPELQAKMPNPRLPQQAARSADPTLGGDPGSTAGVSIGGAKAGPGRDVSLSLYRPGGTSPFGEIAFHSWEPVDGVADELLVVEPEIRLRTKDGHGIRVTASQAKLEGNLKGGLNLRRGRLSGDVLVEYDRLTEEERAKLPPEHGKEIKPNEVVHINLDEVDFDLEYSKVSVGPGGVHLTASDFDFRASDMEIRFNEDEGRVEHIRITRGGRIELRELSGDLGFSASQTGPRPGPQGTLVEWLRETLSETLATQQTSPAVTPPTDATPLVDTNDQEVPVFLADEGKDDEPPRILRYFAHFEDDVDAKQWIGESAQSRLQADSLEILRTISNEDRERVGSKPEASALDDAQDVGPVSPGERMLLEWGGRLIVDLVLPDDPRWSEDVETQITATGSPVLVSNPDGDATCGQLRLDPNGSKVWLAGTRDDPVVVRSAQEGTMTGLEVFTERSDDDDLHIRVVGPGVLSRGMDASSGEGDDPTESQAEPLMVKFADQLDVRGRFITKRSIDFTGRISSQESRVLERAAFLGGVEMQQGDTSLEADALTLDFGPKRGRGDAHQTVERMIAKGHVVMRQGEDLVTAREIDLVLTTDRDGQMVPLTATALGNVEAVQNARTIRARDRLVVDFEMVSRPAPPFDALKAHARAVKAGLDVTEIDWDARRREYESQERKEVGVKRLQAFGEVTVVDPVQALDLSADELDCTIMKGREIERARVKGAEGHPATVHLGTFTVTGRDIDLNVPDQWAYVPGAGRMSFRSRKDLDGRKVDTPIPISIEWQDWMKYQGRENRAVFSGAVHAYSQTTTEFDCERFLVEFDDVASVPAQDDQRQDWWIFQEFVERLGTQKSAGGPGIATSKFSKQPAYLLATGGAVALTSEVDPSTGKLKSRARLAGDKLSVNLRQEVSKMLIESPGTLLLEDFRAASGPEQKGGGRKRGLFGADEDTGPSKTLIEWQDAMWYDFSINQTRFEGDVVLKHFSGSRLQRVLGRSIGGSEDGGAGRSTYLTCDVLTADFLGRRTRAHQAGDRRMGRLSAAQLRQFQAIGTVKIQDETEGISLTADRVVYERDRDILAIYGTKQRPAQIWVQKPGELPTHFSAARMFYDVNTGSVEASGATVTGR